MLNNKFNRVLKLTLCTCFVSYFQFIIGSSYVFSSILITKLKEPQSPIKINDESASWIASVPLLVCPVGLLLVGILTDKIGSKKALQVSYVPNILSWVVLAYANTFETVIIGRILLGLTFGSGSCATLYVAEVCPTKYRSLAFSVILTFVGLGMVCCCGLALLFPLRTICLSLFVMSAAGCASLFLLPESPMWLRSNGRVREAEAAEKWLGAAVCMDTGTITDDVAVRDAQDKSTQPAKSWCTWTSLKRPTVWKPTVIILVFFVCQQLSGFFVLLFYSVDVLKQCRVRWDGITVTLYLSVSRVLGSLAFSVLYRVHRKTLTVISGIGMAVSLGAIVAYVHAYKNVADPPYGEVPVVAFLAYTFFTMVAIMPLPWTLCSEVFPMAVKGAMGGIVFFFGFELMFIVIKVYPSLISRFGVECVWLVFTGFCAASALFGAFVMPETKGKTLDEISMAFESHKKTINNNST